MKQDMIVEKIKMMVPLKHLSNFWRTLKMPLINYEINLILSWSANPVTYLMLLQIKQQHL